MKRSITPSGEEKRERSERLEAISAQYWQRDLDQLDALEQQWQRDQVPYLRRVALHLGTLVLSASGAPSRPTGRYGRFSAAELAAELGPVLAPAAQFMERHGFSIIPVPAPLLTLVELLGGPGRSAQQPQSGLLDLLHGWEASSELSEEFTAQYWKEDLDQLKALDVQRKRDLASFLRRAAMGIGARVLAASGAPGSASGLYGRYTAADLVGELGPILAPSLHFLERQDFTVLPIPGVVTTLIELLAKMVEQGRALPPETSADPAGVGEKTGTAQKEHGKQQVGVTTSGATRAVPNKDTRARMRFSEEGTI